MKRLTKIGLIVTGAWALAFAIVIYFRAGDAIGMDLNEWGDFLAGAFAPLALFWLVIGYFQHGQELRLNTKALKTQEEELRRQAKETARLVDATQEELGFMQERERREAMPDLVPTGGGARTSDGALVTDLQNRGAEVRDIVVICEESYGLTFSPSKIWEPNKIGHLILRHTEHPSPDYPILFSIECVDLVGYLHTINCELLGDNMVQILGHTSKNLTMAELDEVRETVG